jgi:APA family basic amino acid/polyamine antiporter
MLILRPFSCVNARLTVAAACARVKLRNAIANASALTLRAEELRWPRWLAAAGVAGCVLMAFSLPWESVAARTTVGAAVFGARRVMAGDGRGG